MAVRGRQSRREDPDDEGGAGGLTDDQRDEISALVNSALTSQLQRRLPSIVAQAIEAPLRELRTQIESGSRGRQRQDDPPDDLDDPDVEQTTRQRGRGRQQPARREREVERERDAPERDPDRGRARPDDDRFAKMQAKLDKLERERQTERETARAATRDASLRELLSAGGVDKNRLRGALAVLRESARYDDKANEWYFSRKVDGLDEEIDLDGGVKDWLTTDEGKSYLAPQGAGGLAAAAGQARPLRSGSGTAARSTARAGDNAPARDRATAKAQATAQAKQQLADAITSLGSGGVSLG